MRRKKHPALGSVPLASAVRPTASRQRRRSAPPAAKVAEASAYLDLTTALTHADLMLLEATERQEINPAELASLSETIQRLAARIRQHRETYLNLHPAVVPDED